MSTSHPDENHPHERAEHQKMRHLSNGTAPSSARLAQIFIIALGSIAFAYFARPVVLPLMLALLAAATLRPPVAWLKTFHIPASLSAAIILGIFLFAAGAGTTWLGRPAVNWAKSAPEKIPQLKERYRKILQPAVRLSAAASSIENFDSRQSSTNSAPPVAVKDNHMMGAMFTWTRSLVTGIGEAIVLTFLLLVSGDTLMEKMAGTLSNHRQKKQAVEISREVQRSISRYLFTVSLINIGLGCAVGIVFWLVGMPNAAMWGGVAGLLNFLPFFGPIAGIGIVGMAGLLAFDTFGGALVPVAVYAGLHLLESYFVTPFALGQRFRINKAIIFLAFIFFAWLWGVIGALLAMPLLVSVKVVCERVPGLLPVAEFLSP